MHCCIPTTDSNISMGKNGHITITLNMPSGAAECHPTVTELSGNFTLPGKWSPWLVAEEEYYRKSNLCYSIVYHKDICTQLVQRCNTGQTTGNNCKTAFSLQCTVVDEYNFYTVLHNCTFTNVFSTLLLTKNS